MRTILAALILCLVATASAQFTPGKTGAVVRLLRQRAGVPCSVSDPADEVLVEATRGHAGAPPGQLSKAHVRKALGKVAGDDATRLAVWLDDGEWLTGTTPAQKAAAVKALMRHARLEETLGAAVRALVAEPVGDRPSPFEALLGYPDTTAEAWAAWVASTDALQATLAPALGLRITTGVWADWLTVEQRDALQRHLGRVDVLDVARHLNVAPP